MKTYAQRNCIAAFLLPGLYLKPSVYTRYLHTHLNMYPLTTLSAQPTLTLNI